MTDPKYLTPEQRKEFARQVRIAGLLPVHYMRCRLLRHAWEPMVPDISSELGSPLAFRCLRCETKRYDFYDVRWGWIISRRYAYAEGYLLTRDDGKRGNEPMRIDAVRLAYGRAKDL